jgi:hypothetical protein
VAGWIKKIIIPLCGPSFKLRFARISVRLKFQDGPSVAITFLKNQILDAEGFELVACLIGLMFSIVSV